MVMTQRKSTRDFTPKDSVGLWSEWNDKQFGGLKSDVYGDVLFDGTMHTSHSGSVIMTKVDAARHRVTKSQGTVDSNSVPYLKIVAPWSGYAKVSQLQRQAIADPQGWVIYDTTSSYQVENPTSVEHLILMIPKADAVHKGCSSEIFMARRLGANGISRVALDTMRSIYLQLPFMDESTAKGAGDAIVELVRLSLMEVGGQETQKTQHAAMLDRIKWHVKKNLADPMLGAQSIAKALNCSRRHLYNAFSGLDESLSEYILRLRLEACKADLMETHRSERQITEIAFSWGFSNSSHFSRTFKEYVGSTPSEFRTLHAQTADA